MNQLEMETWHTTQRENPKDYEREATPWAWGKIVEAIGKFQNEHDGDSPTNTEIGAMVGFPAGRVSYHLREMMDKGLVKVIATEPRRQLAVPTLKPSTPLPISSVKDGHNLKTAKLASEANEWGGYFTEEAFMRAARNVADATIRFTQKHGHAPSNRHIAEMLGFKSGSTVGRVVESMVSRGWFHHVKNIPNDYAVTGLGRDVLDLNKPVQTRPAVATDVPVTRSIPPVMVEVRADTSVAPSIATTMKPDVRDDLSIIDTIDLMIEMQRRGFKVSR